MVGRAAGTCFSLGAERLPELKTWVESSLRASQDKALERKFGALKVQVLVHAQPGTDATQRYTEVDVLLRRSGTPGTSGWTSTCQKKVRPDYRFGIPQPALHPYTPIWPYLYHLSLRSVYL